MSRTSAAGSLDTKFSIAPSKKDKCFGAFEKAYSIPAVTILSISDLCLLRAAPTNVTESRAARSLQS